MLMIKVNVSTPQSKSRNQSTGPTIKRRPIPTACSPQHRWPTNEQSSRVKIYSPVQVHTSLHKMNTELPRNAENVLKMCVAELLPQTRVGVHFDNVSGLPNGLFGIGIAKLLLATKFLKVYRMKSELKI